MAAVDTRVVGGQVREYFNTEGFNRWNKIYSDSEEVNVVQMQIRNNHQITVDKVRRPPTFFARPGPHEGISSRVGLCYRLGGDGISDLSAFFGLGGDRTDRDSSPQGSLRVYPRTLL